MVHARSAITGEQLDGKATLTITALQAPFETDSGPITYDPPSLVMVRFADQAGSFRVRVKVAGYRAWEEVVTVEAGRCGVAKTVIVTAALPPIPG